MDLYLLGRGRGGSSVTYEVKLTTMHYIHGILAKAYMYMYVCTFHKRCCRCKFHRRCSRWIWVAGESGSSVMKYIVYCYSFFHSILTNAYAK